MGLAHNTNTHTDTSTSNYRFLIMRPGTQLSIIQNAECSAFLLVLQQFQIRFRDVFRILLQHLIFVDGKSGHCCDGIFYLSRNFKRAECYAWKKCCLGSKMRRESHTNTQLNTHTHARIHRTLRRKRRVEKSTKMDDARTRKKAVHRGDGVRGQEGWFFILSFVWGRSTRKAQCGGD